MVFTLKKKNAPILWVRLTKGKKIKNMYDWKEVQDKHRQANLDQVGEEKRELNEKKKQDAANKAKNKEAKAREARRKKVEVDEEDL